MNKEHSQKSFDDEEIDLREVWSIIVKKKWLIIEIVVISTLIAMALVYMNMSKPVKSSYQASVLFEIGKSIQGEDKLVSVLENSYDLKVILERLKGIVVTIPPNSERVLLMSFSSSDKNIATKKLQESVDFILKRHGNMAKNYPKVIMSEMLGDIVIKDTTSLPSVKENMKIVFIVFLLSLFLAIFLVLFLENVKNGKNEL